MKTGTANLAIISMALLLIALTLGCVSSTGTDITSIVKAMPEAKAFLNEYPNATIVVALWDNATVSSNLASIQKDCGNQITVREYYRVFVSDPSLSLVLWLDKSNYNLICAIKKSTGLAANEEKGNIVEQYSFNITEPAEISSPITEYCGNGKCDSGENSNTCPEDCLTTAVPLCGNSHCDSGETIESCVADCGYEIYPYEADVKYCQDAGGTNYSSTGEGSANWFLYGKCGSEKYFHSVPGYKMIFYAYTDSCDSCVCIHPNFYIYELINGTWTNMKYIDMPDEKGIGKYISYMPVSYNVKIYATGCFYMKAYSENYEQNRSECNELYWFDNNVKECTKKKFCGFYMYNGLRTFVSEAECKAALPNVPSNLSLGQCYSSVSNANSSLLTQRLITKGSCSDWSGYHQDFCIDGTNLKDYFCGPTSHTNQSCLYTIFNCANYGFNSCSEGMCINISTYNPSMLRLNETNNGMQYILSYGSEVNISLVGNPSTGYNWIPNYTSGMVLENEGSISFQEDYCEDGICRVVSGANATKYWVFKLSGSGQQSFQAAYTKYSNASSISKWFNVAINIIPATNVTTTTSTSTTISNTTTTSSTTTSSTTTSSSTTTTSSSTTTTSSTTTSTTLPSYCNDTDGMNFYSRGIVYYGYSYNYSSLNDTCANSTLLMERYCNGTYPATYYHECNCQNGTCVNTTMLILNETNNGMQYNLSHGSSVNISLVWGPSTGYQWFPNYTSGMILESEGSISQEEQCEGEVCMIVAGGPATKYWVFELSGSGQQIFEAAYMRPGNANSTTNRFNVTINIIPTA